MIDLVIIYLLFFTEFTYFLTAGEKDYSLNFLQVIFEMVVYYSTNGYNLWFNGSYSNLWRELLSLSSEGIWGKASPWSTRSKARWSLCAQRIWHLTSSSHPGQLVQVRLGLQGRLNVSWPACLFVPFFGWYWLIANRNPLAKFSCT